MKKSDWISVNDRLPKRGERVYIVRKCGSESFADVGTLVAKEPLIDERWYTDDGWDIECVTHWQKIVLP